MAEQDLKIELAADLDRARAKLARHIGSVRHDLDVATHIKHSFHEHKAAYIGGAGFLGLLLSKLPSRKKKIYVDAKSKGAAKEVEKAGVWLLLLKFLFDAARPMLTSLLSKQVTSFVKSRVSSAE